MFVGENRSGKTTLLDAFTLPILEYKTGNFGINSFNNPGNKVKINIYSALGAPMFWGKLGTLILSIFLIWWLWHTYKTQPEFFSGKNISKSFTTMGILALILIGFIALVVIYLRHS